VVQYLIVVVVICLYCILLLQAPVIAVSLFIGKEDSRRIIIIITITSGREKDRRDHNRSGIIIFCFLATHGIVKIISSFTATLFTATQFTKIRSILSYSTLLSAATCQFPPFLWYHSFHYRYCLLLYSIRLFLYYLSFLEYHHRPSHG